MTEAMTDEDLEQMDKVVLPEPHYSKLLIISIALAM